MKPVEEVVACVCDYGTFVSLAERLGRDYKKVYYYSPFEAEYQDAKMTCKGDGLDRVNRLDEPLDPKNLDEIDFYIFPDIAYSGQQRLLRDRLDKKVWGSMGACELELYRTTFLTTIKKLGLQIVPYEKIVGLTALSDHLKTVENKWVKVNRYRGNMETWKHRDYPRSIGKLTSLRVEFGPYSEHAVFVVQDEIPDAREIGYDGFFINRQFPPSSFQGYEKKNQLYLGSMRKWGMLPEAVRAVNEAMAPILDRYGYCNFWALEIRWLSDDEFYFIDPTARTPGQTGEQNFETMANLPELMWKAANGENIAPKWTATHAAAATIHHTDAAPEEWKTFGIPEDVKRWAKLYHVCEVDGLFHVPPGKNDEVGVLLGTGNDVQSSFEALKENVEKLNNEPLKMELNGFADLLKDIEKAEEEGMEFSDKPMPEPAEVLR